MKTLEIEIPKGYVIDIFDQKAGKLKFKEEPKNVMERIKTVADVLADNGLTLEEFEEQCDSLTKDEEAYRILKMLAKSLNEGWAPDWNNSNEGKYNAWFYMGGSSGFRFDVCDDWNARSDVGSRLCFKTRELAEYAAKQFTDVYKQFMTI
jgi:hypothetical protein